MNADHSAAPVRGLEQTLPSSWYYSEEIFQLEKERIFCREWFCAGREEELPKPGDHLVLDIVGREHPRRAQSRRRRCARFTTCAAIEARGCAAPTARRTAGVAPCRAA